MLSVERFDFLLSRTALHKYRRDRALTSLQGKLLFIKDMAYYLCPSEDASPSIALSLSKKKRGVGTVNGHSNGTLSDITNGATTNADALESVHEPRNPSVIPTKTLGEFQFAFLIRHPRYSIPSFFRCTVPPLDKQTGFYDFIPSEAGYKELRRMFDYLLSMGQVGPRIGHDENGHESDENGAHGHQVEGHQNGGEKALKPPPKKVEVCLVDADDLLDHPAAVISAFCKSVGLEYDESMLKWDTEEDKKHAEEAFEKWKGFHEDAIDSDCLRPRAHVSHITDLSQFDRSCLQPPRSANNRNPTMKRMPNGAKSMARKLPESFERPSTQM